MRNIKLTISISLLLAVLMLLGACGGDDQNNVNDENRENVENDDSVGSPEVNNTAKVSTFAGTAVGMGYVDGVGDDARFRLPQAMVSDGEHLYIVDTWNNIVRKLVIATGEVTTFAGVARNQNFIDGVGNDARLFSPRAITIVDNKVYLTDRNTVRSIDIATREVVTIAGTFSLEAADPTDGIGTEARFGNLAAITSNGTSLFVAESESKNIRKITLPQKQLQLWLVVLVSRVIFRNY